MTAIAILFGATFTVAVCLAVGKLLLRDATPDVGLRFVAGAAILSAAVFALCAAQLVYPLIFAGCGAAIVFLGLRRGMAAPKVALPGVAAVAFGVYFVLYFFNSMAPEISYDGSRYHLGLVSRYLREHGFGHPIADNMYASLSQGVEMLYLFAFSFGKHSAAAMVHFAFLLALAGMIYSYAVRIGFPMAGVCASLLVFACPVVGVDGISAYNDVAVAAIAFALFYLLQVWDAERSARLLPVIGLVAGFAYAAKYTAWLAVPYAVGFVAWKSRRLRDVSIVVLFAAMLVAPWMLKNWLWVQNPLAPFYNDWFPNPHVTVEFERGYRQNMAAYSLKSSLEIPLQVTVHGSLSGLLGPVFLLSPLALLALRKRAGRQLLLAALVFGANYFSNIGTRFLIPVLPFVALAMALVLSGVPRLALGIALMHAVISWPSLVRQYCRFDAWHLVKVPFREALRIKPEDGFLESNLPYYGAVRMIERNTPPGSTVFVFTPIPEAYTSRNVRVAYQSAHNIGVRGILWSAFVPVHTPKLRLRFRFPKQPVRALRFVQTAETGDVWSIHEIHAGLGGRVTASTYPWEIDWAADGNPLTFWAAGDTMRPGQFVQMDFASAQELDRVELEAAPNQPGLSLRLEGLDSARLWKTLADAPEISEVAAVDRRRAASAEVRKRGVDYLMMFDGEFGADEFRHNAEAWGMRLAGEYRGARLYQLP